jgi:hypothetical protein
MGKSNETWMPQWVALPILDFARIVHSFGDDAEALGSWIKKFAEDLLFCNTDTSNDFVKTLLEESADKYEKKSKAGRKGGNAKARNKRNSGSATPTDKREQGDDNTANDASGIGPEPDSHLKNGDALSGDTSDGEITRESADPDRTTISEQFEAFDTSKTWDSNTGMQQPSCSPEGGTNIDWHDAVCQALGTTDGNDQETEARQSQTGAGAVPLQNDSCHNTPAPCFPRKSKPPKNAEEVRYFAADHALDVEDARDWYEMNYVERPGCDKDGVAIENWKGHCTAYCRTVKEKRESA